MGIGDWGLGIGDGDWGLGPIPNPQSPFIYYIIILIEIVYFLLNYKYIN
jgi:hypothetical protein